MEGNAGDGLVVAVVAMPDEHGQLVFTLVVQKYGDYAFCKGRMREDETRDETLRRELGEELGVDLDRAEYAWLGTTMWQTRDGDAYPVHLALVTYDEPQKLNKLTNEPDWVEAVVALDQKRLRETRFIPRYPDLLRELAPKVHAGLFA